MEARRPGRTEMQVARTGFGGMTIPKVDVEQAVATIETALGLGVNFIDTGRAYGKGDGERKIRRVMEHRRDKGYLNSQTPDTTYDGIKKAIDQSLEALRTHYIDLYEAHDVPTQAPHNPLMREGGGLLGARFSLKTRPATLKKVLAYTTLAAAVFMAANALIGHAS